MAIIAMIMTVSDIIAILSSKTTSLCGGHCLSLPIHHLFIANFIVVSIEVSKVGGTVRSRRILLFTLSFLHILLLFEWWIIKILIIFAINHYYYYQIYINTF